MERAHGAGDRPGDRPGRPTPTVGVVRPSILLTWSHAEQVTLLEPDVALTDLLLAIESAMLAVFSWRRSSSSALRASTTVFFAALGLSALLGGIHHGLLVPGSPSSELVWRLTLAALGFVALAEWVIATGLIAPRWLRTVTIVAFVECVLYLAWVPGRHPEFRFAIINYVPPTILLLAAFTLLLIRRRALPPALGAAGIVLTFIAAWIQQSRLSLEPLHLSYNALYHLVQAIALVLLFFAFSRGKRRGT